MKGCLARLLLVSTLSVSTLALQSPLQASAQFASSPEVAYDCAGIPNGTTQLTDCGCGQPASSTFVCKACGDNTSCLDCAGTPFGTRKVTGPIGGVPGPDACTLVCPKGTALYPPENRCLSKKEGCQKVNANLIRVGLVTYHPTKEPTTNVTSAVVRASGAAFTTFAGVQAASSCIAQALSECLPKGQQIGYMLTARRQGGNNTDADWCVGNIVRQWGVNPFASHGAANLFGAPTDWWQGFAYVSRHTSQGCGPAPAELIALKEELQCNPQDLRVVVFSSPVSLLWSGDVDIDSVLSFSSFPLSGKDEGKVFQWRASGMTPLVVYDSTGLGEIKDATQLFGNHTFGKEWNNGYEALASLDIDKSGWLEGEELNAVALWFDFNQDGVSQKGEVKRLSDAGVHAIGVKGDSVDEKTKNIFASQGFKRTVDGKEIVGRSVDWFGGDVEGASPDSLRTREQQPAKDAAAQAAVKQEASGEVEKIDLRTTVSGVWEWHMTDDKALLPEQQPGGFLAFTQDGSGLRGQSVSTESFLPNMYQIDEKVTSIPVSGRFGPEGVTFEIKGEKGKTVALSSAKLSSDGMTLTGTTTEEAPIEGGTAKVTFSWEARRLIRAE